MFDNGESVIWHRWTEGGTDDYGMTLPGGYSDVVVPGAAFAPESTKEDSPDTRVVSQASLYLTSPIPYRARDQFTVRDLRYAVEGDAQGGWTNPFTGTGHGQEILLKRTTGG